MPILVSNEELARLYLRNVCNNLTSHEERAEYQLIARSIQFCETPLAEQYQKRKHLAGIPGIEPKLGKHLCTILSDNTLPAQTPERKSTSIAYDPKESAEQQAERKARRHLRPKHPEDESPWNQNAIRELEDN